MQMTLSMLLTAWIIARANDREVDPSEVDYGTTKAGQYSWCWQSGQPWYLEDQPWRQVGQGMKVHSRGGPCT